MNKEDICFLSACDMADAIKRQELTSQEITEAIIERIEKINPIINAYCTPTFELAREMAKKADEVVKKEETIPLLNGIPTYITDLMITKGVRTTFGCKIYENNVPKEDEIAVKRLKDAGIVFLGKTNTPAFGHQAVTDNLIFGKTLNPWNLEKTSGGSSGGAAASVVSGLGPLALGSDGGGSIRIPACFCGIYGLKPSFGRIPRYPTHDITWATYDHYGPLVRYVKDAALMLDAMAGADEADKYSLLKPKTSYIDALKDKPKKLKIGYSLNLGFVKAVEPYIEKSILDSVQKFESLDWSVEEAKIKIRKAYMSFGTIITAGLGFDLKPYLKEWRDKLDFELVKMIEAGLSYSAYDIKKAEYQREKIYETIYQYFKNYDILITPSTAVSAFELGKMFPAKIAGRAASPVEWMSFTHPFNSTGNPAASIPCGWTSEGLPIGMQIVGKRYDEKTVLQVSKAFEEIAPWQDKKPKFD
jgi:Asp-tRNA(Asn)/Glu-tRNA(Gln) amidotransferase A subunit family amidase